MRPLVRMFALRRDWWTGEIELALSEVQLSERARGEYWEGKRGHREF